MKNSKPLSDLEMYDLIKAAFPERFPEIEGDDWEDVMEFADWQMLDENSLYEIFGRIVMLTNPMQGGLSGDYFHCLGEVTIKDGEVGMLSAVSRKVEVDED